MVKGVSSTLGYYAALLLLIFLLPVSYVIPVNFSQAQTTDFPQSIIASTNTDTTPHLLKLKATQQGGTETRVSGFSLDTSSAVGAQANSQLLVLVTDNSLSVAEAKVRTASNQVIDLVPTNSLQATAAFSLANLPAGVYTLDVITQKGNAKGAYEGVLSIGNQPRTLIEETTKRVTNEYGDLILIFLSDPCIDNPDLPECQDPCEVNPDLPECPQPIIEIDCGNGITVPEVGECPAEVEDEADDENQFIPIDENDDGNDGSDEDVDDSGEGDGNFDGSNEDVDDSDSDDDDGGGFSGEEESSSDDEGGSDEEE